MIVDFVFDKKQILLANSKYIFTLTFPTMIGHNVSPRAAQTTKQDVMEAEK